MQRWSFLADWKRLMLQKGFSHSSCCTHDIWSFFVSNSVCFWRKGKCFTFLSQLATFFPQAAVIFATNFCELVHRKTFVLPTDCCFWKKDLKIKAERRRNHWRQKRVVFQKTFWTSPRKTGNFEGIVFFLCLVNEISRKSFRNNYHWVEAKFIAFCLFIGQIGSSFFCGRNVSCLNYFFLPLKERF